MKKLYSFLALLTLLFSVFSCSKILQPEHADDRAIKIDVYNNVDYFANISDDDKIYNTEILDWVLNDQVQGDNFMGYFITYRVQTDDGVYYVLVDLVEFFDNDRYEWSVVDIDESLSSIQSNLY